MNKNRASGVCRIFLAAMSDAQRHRRRLGLVLAVLMLLFSVPAWTQGSTKAFEFSPSSITLTEGGASVTLQARLAVRPDGQATLTYTSNSSASYTVSPNELTFDAGNWNQYQSFTLRAKQDSNGDDEHVPAEFFGGGDYRFIRGTVNVQVRDDDRRPVLQSTSVTLNEGGRGSLRVRLASRPSGSVSIATTSADSERVSVLTPQISITSSTWNDWHRVFIEAGRDTDTVDNSVQLSSTASGVGFGGTVNATVNVVDDGRSGVVVSTQTLSMNEGAVATFTARLMSQPATDVTVAVTSPDTGAVTVSPRQPDFHVGKLGQHAHRHGQGRAGCRCLRRKGSARPDPVGRGQRPEHQRVGERHR